MATAQKLVHYYMLITLKHKKVVEKFVKNPFMVKNTNLLNRHILYVHIRGNFNVYQHHMLLILRKPILKYTFIKNHVHLWCLFTQSQSAYQN